MVECRERGKEGHLEGLSGVKCLQQQDCFTAEERKERGGRHRKKRKKLRERGNVESKYKEGGVLEEHQEFPF